MADIINKEGLMSLIRESQTRAKWNDDMERRSRMQKYLDYYRDDCREYIRTEIQNLVNLQESNELCKYIEHDNITSRMIDSISMIFKERVNISLKCRSGKSAEENQIRLNKLLSDLNFHVTMKEVEKLSKLVFDIAVIPQIRNNRIELDIITPEKAFVKQNSEDPTKADAFFYQTGILTNTASPNPVHEYHFWTQDGKFSCLIDDLGTPFNIKQLLEWNHPDIFPVIMFRNYHPVDSFWYDGLNPIVEKNIIIDLKRTDMSMAEAYNIPQRINRGVPEEQEIKLGRTFAMNIPVPENEQPLGDAKYIRPDENLSELDQCILNRIEQLGLSLGLSKSIITGQSATSGYELALSKYEIVERNKSERDYYANSLKDLIKLILAMAGECNGDDYSGVEDIKIDFGEIRFSQSELEKARTRYYKLVYGIASRIDVIMEDNPDLTREQAITKAKQIDKEELDFGKDFDNISSMSF